MWWIESWPARPREWQGDPVRGNRLTPYEPGWLSFLVDRKLADKEAALEAQRRVAIAAVEELERRARLKRRKRRKDR